MPMPPYTRSHGSIGQSTYGSHNNFGGSGSKSASAGKLSWGHPKDAKVDLKALLSRTFVAKSEVRESYIEL